MAGCCFPFILPNCSRALPSSSPSLILIPFANRPLCNLEHYSPLLFLAHTLLYCTSFAVSTSPVSARSTQQVDRRSMRTTPRSDPLFSGCPCFPSAFRRTLALHQPTPTALRNEKRRADDALETENKPNPPPTTHPRCGFPRAVSRSVLLPPPSSAQTGGIRADPATLLLSSQTSTPVRLLLEASLPSDDKLAC